MALLSAVNVSTAETLREKNGRSAGTCCRCRIELLQTHAASFVSPRPASTQTASRVMLRATASSRRISRSGSWNQAYTGRGWVRSRTSNPRAASSSESGCGGTQRFERRRPTGRTARRGFHVGGAAVWRTPNEIHSGPPICDGASLRQAGRYFRALWAAKRPANDPLSVAKAGCRPCSDLDPHRCTGGASERASSG